METKNGSTKFFFRTKKEKDKDVNLIVDAILRLCKDRSSFLNRALIFIRINRFLVIFDINIIRVG